MADLRVEPRNNDEAVLYDTLETRGEANVRADVSTNRWGTRTRDVLEWLNRKEEMRAAEAAAIDERMVVAAERAAEAARDSAGAAKMSALWAKLATLIALAALLVSAWPYLSK